ncbi:hypothetical protein GGF31_003406 [Allomyces arbusculus]|nr:hypothetical protein GGF31_003406 [Allomyces arbusculus]
MTVNNNFSIVDLATIQATGLTPIIVTNKQGPSRMDLGVAQIHLAYPSAQLSDHALCSLHHIFVDVTEAVDVIMLTHRAITGRTIPLDMYFALPSVLEAANNVVSGNHHKQFIKLSVDHTNIQDLGGMQTLAVDLFNVSRFLVDGAVGPANGPSAARAAEPVAVPIPNDIVAKIKAEVNAATANIRRDQSFAFIADGIDSVFDIIDTDGIRSLVETQLPVGHANKTIDMVFVNGHERCGKSFVILLVAIICATKAFEELTGGVQVRPQVSTGPNVTVPVNDLICKSEALALARIGLPVFQKLDKRRGLLTTHQCNVNVFGNSHSEARKLNKFMSSFTGSRFASLVFDEADSTLFQGNDKQGQSNKSETEFRNAMTHPNITGFIMITATPLCLSTLDPDFTIRIVNGRTIRTKTVTLAIPDDYIGRMHTANFTITEFSKDEAANAVETAIADYKSSQMVNTTNPTKKLFPVALVMANVKIDNNKNHAKEYSDASTLTIAFCDKEQLTGYFDKVQLKDIVEDATDKKQLCNMSGTPINDAIAEMISMVVKTRRAMPTKVIVFAYGAAQRGVSFQKLFSVAGIDYLTFISHEVFNFATNKRGECLRSCDSVKQQYLRWPMRLGSFNSIVERAQILVKTWTSNEDIIHDFKSADTIIDHVMADAKPRHAWQYEQLETATKTSNKRIPVHDIARSYNGVSVKRRRVAEPVANVVPNEPCTNNMVPRLQYQVDVMVDLFVVYFLTTKKGNASIDGFKLENGNFDATYRQLARAFSKRFPLTGASKAEHRYLQVGGNLTSFRAPGIRGASGGNTWRARQSGGRHLVSSGTEYMLSWKDEPTWAANVIDFDNFEDMGVDQDGSYRVKLNWMPAGFVPSSSGHAFLGDRIYTIRRF